MLPTNRKLKTIEQIFGDVKIWWTPPREKKEFFGWWLPWVSIRDMWTQREILETSETLSETGIKNSNVKLISKWSLLFSFKLTVWRMCFAGVDLYTNEAIAAFEPNPEIDLNYLYYLLPSVSQKVDRTNNYGAPLLNKSVIKSLKIPLPPLPVQHAIVDALDHASVQITASRAAVQSQLDALDQLWQSTLSEVFENSTIPTKSISEITSLLWDWLHGTPKYDDQWEYYFINWNNLDNWNIAIKDWTKKVSIVEYEKYKKNLNDRTILVSINGTIWNVAFYNNEKVVLGKSACYFNLLDNVDKSYIKYAIMSPYFMQYANKELTGTTIKNVSLKTMRAFQIPLPDLATQTSIVSHLDDVSQHISLFKTQYLTQLQSYDDLWASILDQAFRGELVQEM